MNNFNSIENKFRTKGIVRGKTLLVPINFAFEMVSEAERLGINILGIDGFFIKDDITEPSMNNSIEFDDNISNYSNARDFLESKKNMGLLFEVVFDIESYKE